MELSFFLCLVFVIVCALRFQNYNNYLISVNNDTKYEPFVLVGHELHATSWFIIVAGFVLNVIILLLDIYSPSMFDLAQRF